MRWITVRSKENLPYYSLIQRIFLQMDYCEEDKLYCHFSTQYKTEVVHKLEHCQRDTNNEPLI